MKVDIDEPFTTVRGELCEGYIDIGGPLTIVHRERGKVRKRLQGRVISVSGKGELAVKYTHAFFVE